jgi:glycerol-3-phosphate acyltransferase PlsY
MLPFLLTAAYSYLLGSIPFGYLLVRIFRGQDVRQMGSGNIGATNVSRTSPALGVFTLAFDALKGMAAVLLTREFFPGQALLLGVAALAAIAGHMFPLWLRFRGGKGVATGLGAFVVVAPKAVLLVVGIFALVFLTFRYVSLASILSVAVFPLLTWILVPGLGWAQIMFPAVASLLIIAKHRENILRLWAHTEPRFQWRSG